jgi:hypothetical protein
MCLFFDELLKARFYQLSLNQLQTDLEQPIPGLQWCSNDVHAPFGRR